VKEKPNEQAPIQESLHEESKEESKIVGDIMNQDEPMVQEAEQDQTNVAAGLGKNPLLQKSGPILTSDDDAKSEKSEIEEELNPEEDFRQCGEKIQNCLFEGQEISDQLYVDLYVAKLRMTYEYKDKHSLSNETENDAQEELNLTRNIANLLEEIAQMQDPNSTIKRKKKRTVEVVQKEVNDLQDRLAQIQNVDKNGWILIDFPANFS